MMRRALLWLGWAVVAAGVVAGLLYFAFWYQFVREVTWESWTVALPPGGTLSYAERSPQMRMSFGPSDNRCLLLWTKPNGKAVEYPLGYGGYDRLSVRARPDGKAVWIVDPLWSGVLATLDLESGDLGLFHSESIDGERGYSREGGRYDRDGNQTGDVMRRPAWATVTGGRLLDPTSSYRFQ